MNDHSYELKFLSAALPDLKNYLLSNEVYWNLGVKPPAGAQPYPRFSLGWLLLYRRRVQGDALGGADRDVLDQIADLEERWRSNWARKAGTEFSMRLSLWTRFMNELREQPSANKARYAYEVQRRTMLDLLEEAADEVSNVERELLKAMDAFLLGRLVPGSFIEDSAHAAQFPGDRFWYLYGLPRADV